MLSPLAVGLGRSRAESRPTFRPRERLNQYVASFREKSIAVLPFRDLDPKTGDVSLADGVQDDILTALSKIADLRVISSTSADTYGVELPRILREVAQSLGVAFVLEGGVHAGSGKIFVDVQLTDARRGRRVWSQTYKRPALDVFGMRGDLVQRIATMVQANITPREAAALQERPTKDVVAYSLYVRGKTMIAGISFSAQVREKLFRASRLLRDAIARDPNFDLAYVQLAAADDGTEIMKYLGVIYAWYGENDLAISKSPRRCAFRARSVTAI